MKKLFALAMIAGMVISFSGMAQADNDWRGHERNAHAWHKQHFRHGRGPRREEYYPRQEEPNVVYAPPVVVEPPSGFNIIVPLNFR